VTTYGQYQNAEVEEEWCDKTLSDFKKQFPKKVEEFRQANNQRAVIQLLFIARGTEYSPVGRLRGPWGFQMRLRLQHL
jgi:hypothetical protein